MRARRAWSLVAFTSLLLAGLAGCAAQPQTAGEAQATADVAAATTAPNFDAMPSIRAAFYYPWYPETWKGPNGSLFTNYTPTAGLYDSGTLATIRRHVDELVYANVDVAISSWWGPGHADGRPIRDDPQRDDHEAHPLVAVLRARGCAEPDHGSDRQ